MCSYSSDRGKGIQKKYVVSKTTPHMLLVPEKPLMKTRSTDIRKELSIYWNLGLKYTEKIKNPKFIDQNVFKYISTNGLYQRRS
jgi:hypothetical protein